MKKAVHCFILILFIIHSLEGQDSNQLKIIDSLKIELDTITNQDVAFQKAHQIRLLYQKGNIDNQASIDALMKEAELAMDLGKFDEAMSCSYQALKIQIRLTGERSLEVA